jgi:hypothetical protein
MIPLFMGFPHEIACLLLSLFCASSYDFSGIGADPSD